MSEKLTILYVDDEESNLNVFKNTFRREYKVFTAINAFEGLEILNREKIDLILTDQRMPEMNGVEFLKKTLDNHPNLNRILVTGYTDFGALTEAINEARIFQFIQKPWDENQLREVIEKGLQIYKLKTENDEMRLQLEQQNAELEKVNNGLLEYDKLKSDFLAIISHEIRTPLNGLKGPFDLLKAELGTQKSGIIETLLNTLEISVSRLEQFVLSALHITSFKAKKYELVLNYVNVTYLVNDVLSIFLAKATEKQVTFQKNIPEKAKMVADKDLIFICLKEIIDNAVKYSPEQSVIDINFNENDSHIQMSVSDRGKGFSLKVLQHLFDPFVAEDRFVGSNIGLDLTLVKLIMDAHEGEIKIYNRDDKGAVVELILKKNLQ